ncbi:hypothetical protein [Dryocola sp. BD586]|uniref:hypothetical protein n=1 Tax=Dryocola sp. BD586 TaxID=3133271 RepID=UPI003F5086F1
MLAPFLNSPDRIASCRRGFQPGPLLLPPHHNLRRFVTYYASQPIADYFSLPAQLINEVVAIDYGSFGYQADHRGPNGAAYQLRTFFILAHSPALFLMPLEKLAQFFKRAMAQGYELRRTAGSGPG